MTSLVQPVDATFAPVVLLTSQGRYERHEQLHHDAARESPATRRVTLRPLRDSSKLAVMAKVKVKVMRLRLLSPELLLSWVWPVVLVRSLFRRGVVPRSSLTSANQSQPGDRH